MATCEECHKAHPELVEVKATAYFKNRRNEWLTHFCPRCLDYIQKVREVERWQRKEIKK